MKIEKLEIRNFGKMQNRTLEFSDGIQLISGENESGKSTVHTFIRSMLFGMTRGRGRAAKNDVYSRYEPWENPAYYAGEMVLESGGKRFRLTRNFGRQNANAKLVCLTDGEVLSVEDGDLSMLLGGVSEIVYDNTASIGQLKGRTEEGLADELRNYMANYQGSSDGELDVAAALDLLKQKRKRLEQEQKKMLAGLGKSAAGERADEAGYLSEGCADRTGAEDEKRISEEPQMGCRVRGAGWISLVLMHSAVLPY